MLHNLKWLGKADEIEFEKNKFKGTLAGKAWKYSRNLDGLIRVRAVIFIMAILVYFPVITNYFIHDFFSPELLFERFIYSVMLITAGVMFNRFRVLTIVVATIPLALILLNYVMIAGQFDNRKVAFTIAIIVLILSGIFHHFKLLKLRKELEANL